MAELLRKALAAPYVDEAGSPTGHTRAERLAEVYVDLALGGHFAALQWIVERTEGKVTERVEQVIGGTIEHRARVDPETVEAVLAEYARAGGALPGGG